MIRRGFRFDLERGLDELLDDSASRSDIFREEFLPSVGPLGQSLPEVAV